MTTLTRFSNIAEPRDEVTSMSLTEAATAEGLRYSHEFDFVYAGNEVKYFLYEVPADSEFTIAVQNRSLKTDTESCDFRVLWYVDSYTPGTLEHTFNEYNKYTDPSVFQVSEVTDVVGGLVRERDFIEASGSGNNSRGDVAPDLGFRLYAPGTYGIVEVTNLSSSDNRIHLSYSWVEIPSNFINL